ncbi:hypothetical protein J3R30DRAFT_3401214 [Lentinula aciculospora]|uniref:Uncharacterized protein n=1 Tax=Lentinula aciculospora TaxID=153920 RepID=A0A9W9AL49_9AGAR|nr:hypothetical protein J3R30DRAFT_3401214 [Lentinula aciculospora]
MALLCCSRSAFLVLNPVLLSRVLPESNAANDSPLLAIGHLSNRDSNTILDHLESKICDQLRTYSRPSMFIGIKYVFGPSDIDRLWNALQFSTSIYGIQRLQDRKIKEGKIL